MPAELDEDGNFELNIPVFKSVNLLRDQQRIGDDELVMSKNVFPVRPGKMGTRPGSLVINLNYGGVGGGGNRYPQSGIVSQFMPSVAALVAIWEDGTNGSIKSTKIIRVPQEGTTAGFLFNTGVTCRRPLFVQYDSSILCFPGYPYNHSYVKLLGADSGITATAIDFIGSTTNRTPQGGCAYRSRFVHWNFGPGFESYLLFSDNYHPDIVQVSSGDPLASNGRALIIGGARDGDRIVACVELMLTAVGSPTQSALLVLKEKTVYLVTGEPNQTTDNQATIPFVNTLQVARVAYNCGCSAPETVAVTPYGTFWAGPDDVWMFQLGAGTPVRVGSKIRPALLRTPPSMKYKWTGVYFNGLYRLTLAGDGQSPGDYDLLTDEWWLDLRDGPPIGDPAGAEAHESASWWGPMQYSCFTANDTAANIGTYFLLLDDRTGFDPVLYGVNKATVATTITPGVVLIQRDAEVSRDITYDAAYWITQGVSITTVDQILDSEITPELWTKQFDFGVPKLQKCYEGLDLALWLSEMFGITVSAILDDGLSIDTQTRVIDQSGFVLGQGQLNIGLNLSKVPQAIAVKSSPSRVAGYTAQLRLYTTAGYWVDSTNNRLQFEASGAPYGTAVIADGFYASMTTLGAAIVAGMNLISGAEAFSFVYGTGSFGEGRNPRITAATLGAGTWKPVISSVGSPTARLLALMGFDLSATYGFATTHIGGPTYQKIAPAIEMSQFVISGILIPRPPI